MRFVAVRFDVRVPIVDATNVTVFVRADALGLDSTESPMAIEDDEELFEQLEQIRAATYLDLGLVNEKERDTIECPTIPFIAIVSSPQAYATTVDGNVDSEDIDTTARVVSTSRPHHAYAMTGVKSVLQQQYGYQGRSRLMLLAAQGTRSGSPIQKG